MANFSEHTYTASVIRTYDCAYIEPSDSVDIDGHQGRLRWGEAGGMDAPSALFHEGRRDKDCPSLRSYEGAFSGGVCMYVCI